jgi:uncharacterized protein (TIGR02246 family)
MSVVPSFGLDAEFAPRYEAGVKGLGLTFVRPPAIVLNMHHIFWRRTSMRSILFAMPLLLLGMTAEAASTKAAIDAANQKWLAAFNKGDAAGVAALYDDQATVLPPGSDMVQGRAAIEKFWAAAMQSGLKNPSLQTVTLEQFGNAAREIGRVSADALNAQKQPVHIEGKYVVLWKRVKGAWVLDTDIWNLNQ